MAIRWDGHVYRILNADYHPGQGKMGGVTHARLKNLDTGTQWELSFRSEVKVEDIAVNKQMAEFLYEDSSGAHFMNPDTYEQFEVPENLLGPEGRFLVPQQRIGVEFVEGRPVGAIVPGIAEARVVDTSPPVHQTDSNWKPARLENGVEIRVPQFIKSGDVVRVDLETLRYMDRVASKDYGRGEAGKGRAV
jgi:elongation factor P